VTPTGLDKITLQSPFAFIWRSGPIPIVFYFPLRPQQVQIEYPSRAQLHQTLDSNFLDYFPGPRSVVARVQLRGTFGYSKKMGGLMGVTPGTGAFHMKSLEVLYETFNALQRQIQSKLRAREEFTCPGRGYYWRVHIDSLGIRQANQDPLLFYYELSFFRLTDYLSLTGGGIMDLVSSFSIPPMISSAISGLF
jgi:hypothetical protein